MRIAEAVSVQRRLLAASVLGVPCSLSLALGMVVSFFAFWKTNCVSDELCLTIHANSMFYFTSLFGFGIVSLTAIMLLQFSGRGR